MLFYSVGILVLVLAANTGIYSGPDAGDMNRTAINVIASIESLAVLGILVFPWKNSTARCSLSFLLSGL